jgi:predicted nucleic acid-binding protein
VTTALVVDASVAAKWFLPPEGEDLVPEALAIFRDHLNGRIQFLVPDLFWVEIGSIAWKAVRRRRWTIASARKAIAAASALEATTFKSKPLLEAAFLIATNTGASVYDAHYVALAAETGASLVTADEKLLQLAGSRFPVRWLGSFSAT